MDLSNAGIFGVTNLLGVTVTDNTDIFSNNVNTTSSQCRGPLCNNIKNVMNIQYMIVHV